MLSGPKAELQAALAEFLAEARRDLAPHPTPEELLAYGAGELPAAEEAKVQDHLVLCPHCRELLLDHGRLGDPEFGREHDVPPAAKEAAWQALWARLGAGEAPRAAPRRRPGLHLTLPLARLARFFASPRPAYALAASLLVAVAGLSFRWWQLERSVASLSRPQLNAPVVDLLPASPLRGEQGEETVVELPASSRFFALILSPKGAPAYAGYRAEIVAPGGRVVWSEGGLEKNRHGTFTLILARRFLGAGEHRLRLYGRQGESERLIGEFRVRIVP
jgi:hypothetical protein